MAKDSKCTNELTDQLDCTFQTMVLPIYLSNQHSLVHDRSEQKSHLALLWHAIKDRPRSLYIRFEFISYADVWCVYGVSVCVFMRAHTIIKLNTRMRATN